MAVTIYIKLVRDKIPQIIRLANKEPCTSIASEEEVKPLLIQKLIEELQEFKATPNEEELADIIEVIDGIVDGFNLNLKIVQDLKQKKKDERGGFKERIFLEKVIQ